MFEAIPNGPTCLMVIDFQTRLFDVMPETERSDALTHARLAIEGAKALGLPIITTEQYPKGLGHTHPLLSQYLDALAFEKLSFSAASEPRVMAALSETGCTELLIVGMETHICVLQTVAELTLKGYRCHVLEDAVLSRSPKNKARGCELMARMGAVVSTTEIALFGLLRGADHPGFKAISRLVR